MAKFSLHRVSFLETQNFCIVNYGVYYGIGCFLVVQLFFIHWYRLKGPFSPSFALFTAITVPFSTVIFSKLLYLLYNCKRLFKDTSSVLNETGYAFFGGLAGILFSLWMMGHYFYPNKIVALFDMAFLALPLAQIFQRIGCMTYGCCYGHSFSGPTAIIYQNADYKAYRNVGDTPVHNTQFYSVLKNIVLLVMVNLFFFKFPYNGIAFSMWLIMYGTLRFFVDFTRFVQPPYLAGLRITQLFSIIIFFIGVVNLLRMELVPYHFAHPFRQAFIDVLPVIPYSLLAFMIIFICYGYHSRTIGYYIDPRKEGTSQSA